MKKPPPPALKVAAIAIVGAGFLLWRAAVGGKNEDFPQTAAASAPVPELPPDATSADSLAVFRKAFWRRPGDGDRILHAERREWRDAEGVSQWQWFLAVEPSPALVKYLREENAFGLAPDNSGSAPATGAAGRFHQAPEWFPAGGDGFDILRSPSGSLRLLFNKTANQLYATDSGHGFRPGAAGPAAAAVTAAKPPSASGGAPRRLPDAPPPSSPAPSMTSTSPAPQ